MSAQTIAPGRSIQFPGTAFDVVALATSAGGLAALSTILTALPTDFPAALVIVQHRGVQEPFQLPEVLSRRTRLRVGPAREGTILRPATVFVAPPDWPCWSIGTAPSPCLIWKKCGSFAPQPTGSSSHWHPASGSGPLPLFSPDLAATAAAGFPSSSRWAAWSSFKMRQRQRLRGCLSLPLQPAQRT